MFVHASRLGKQSRFSAGLKTGESYEPLQATRRRRGGSFLGSDLKSFAAPHPNRGTALLKGVSPLKPAIHEAFSELSRVVDATIMQAAGHLHNLGIVFRRELSHLP